MATKQRIAAAQSRAAKPLNITFKNLNKKMVRMNYKTHFNHSGVFPGEDSKSGPSLSSLSLALDSTSFPVFLSRLAPSKKSPWM